MVGLFHSQDSSWYHVCDRVNVFPYVSTNVYVCTHVILILLVTLCLRLYNGVSILLNMLPSSVKSVEDIAKFQRQGTFAKPYHLTPWGIKQSDNHWIFSINNHRLLIEKLLMKAWLV